MPCPKTLHGEIYCFQMREKCNSDSPDGINYYWHDLRQKSNKFLCRQMEGGSVRIWGAFSYAEKKCDL